MKRVMYVHIVLIKSPYGRGYARLTDAIHSCWEPVVTCIHADEKPSYACACTIVNQRKVQHWIRESESPI